MGRADPVVVGVLGVSVAIGLGLAVVGAALLAGGGVSSAAYTIARVYPVPPRVAELLVRTARAVGADPYQLADLVHYETGGEWSPSTVGRGTARGYIGITERSARRLGIEGGSEAVAAMDAATQWAWIRHYLERVAAGDWPDGPYPSPLDTPQRLWMAVFYPPARSWDLDRQFPAAVRSANPGIDTPGDYVRQVRDYGRLSGRR